MNRLMPLLFTLAIILTFSQCSGCSSDNSDNSEDITIEDSNSSDSEENYTFNEDDPTASAAEALRKAADQLENMGSERKEVTSPKVLKEVMPNRLLGMEQTDISGEKAGVAGMSFSNAEATYEDGDKRIEVTITDAGGTGLMQLGAAAWLQMEFEREGDDGYERTTTIDGMKAFEKYDNKSNEGELALYYKNRYIIALSGDDVKEGDLRKAWKQLDVDLPE